MELLYKITDESGLEFVGHRKRPIVVKEALENIGLKVTFELLGRYTPVDKTTSGNGRAYSYTRFSTVQQGHGDSYRRQIDAAQEYADINGLQLDTASYVDRGISAFKGKNATEGALSAFLDAIDNGKVEIGSTLIIEHLDRLSRDQVLRALHLFSSIVEKGINIYTTADKKLYTAENINDFGQMVVFYIGQRPRMRVGTPAVSPPMFKLAQRN